MDLDEGAPAEHSHQRPDGDFDVLADQVPGQSTAPWPPRLCARHQVHSVRRGSDTTVAGAGGRRSTDLQKRLGVFSRPPVAAVPGDDPPAPKGSMRELYAVELRPSSPEVGADAAARRLISEWATRPFEDIEATSLEVATEIATGTGRIVVNVGPSSEWRMRWWCDSDVDPSLVWLVEASVTGPLTPPIVTLRIRIGQRERAAPVIGPLIYEFRSPAIVRTLLRELTVEDVGRRVTPSYEHVGASAIDDLVAFLCDPDRRLPVVVLSADPSTGRSSVDARDLALELASLAHVTVLTSGLAGRELSAQLGAERSVWSGAARIYWPGFDRSGDPYIHKRWLPQRLTDPRRLPLVDELRRWLGALSSARIGPHPALRAISAGLAARSDEMPAWIQEYVESVEAERDDAVGVAAEAQAELAAREARIAELEDDVTSLQRSFGEVARARAKPEGVSEPHVERIPETVRDAVERAIAEAGDTCVFLDSARDSGNDFDEYEDPGKLYRAICDVAEASRRFGDSSLGMNLASWFRERGYGYSAREPAARARGTKARYRIRYKDRDEYMEPHLKVDEATHPDQCLRIYWYTDEDDRIFVVGHIGRHL